jgi:hypothetical protein
MQTNPDIAPLFVRRKLRCYIKSGDISKYCTTGYFCSHTYSSAKRGWRYIGIWLHIPISQPERFQYRIYNEIYLVEFIDYSFIVLLQ